MRQANVIYAKSKKIHRQIPTKIVYLPSELPKDSSLIFTKEQCEWIINYGQKLNGAPAAVGGGLNPQVNTKIRDANVYPFPLNELTEPLYHKIMSIVERANQEYGFDIDGIPHEFQLLRYEVGGHYNWHMDMGGINQDRKISVVVALSDPADYDGGELEINDGGLVKLPRQQGMVSTFPSYVMHTVNPVTRGVRWSLVTWITGTPFK